MIDTYLFFLSWNVNSDTDWSESCWLVQISIYNTTAMIRTLGDNARRQCWLLIQVLWRKNLCSECDVWILAKIYVINECTLLRKLYMILLGLSKQSGCGPLSSSRQIFCSTWKRILSLNPRGIVACKLKYLRKVVTLV